MTLLLSVVNNLDRWETRHGQLAAFPHLHKLYLPKYHYIPLWERHRRADRKSARDYNWLPTLCPPESVGMSGTWRVQRVLMLFSLCWHQSCFFLWNSEINNLAVRWIILLFALRKKFNYHVIISFLSILKIVYIYIFYYYCTAKFNPPVSWPTATIIQH